MPVRDLDSFMAPRSGLRIVANRGTSGIDGFVSTSLGVALASEGPVVAFAGDLSLLHDQNGFLLLSSEPVDLSIVVVNNDGGGIFSFLPQARYEKTFEQVFGTPHGLNLAKLADVYGIAHRLISAPTDLPSAVAEPHIGVRILEVRTVRSANLDFQSGTHSRKTRCDSLARSADHYPFAARCDTPNRRVSTATRTPTVLRTHEMEAKPWHRGSEFHCCSWH